MEVVFGVPSFYSLICWYMLQNFRWMHAYISLVDIFFVLLQMTCCTIHESEQRFVFKGRMLTGLADTGLSHSLSSMDSPLHPFYTKQVPSKILDGG